MAFGIIAAILIAVWIAVSFLGAQRDSENMIVIGIPQYETPITTPLIEGFKSGMADLGYTEDKNIQYKIALIKRGPTGEERLRTAVRKQMADGVDLFYVANVGETGLLLEETAASGKPTPIIFAGAGDLIEKNLIRSFQSSGNNATGVANNWEDVAPKQLEFLRKVAPQAKRIGIFTEGFIVPTGPGPAYLNVVKKWAPQLGFELVAHTTDAASREEKEVEMKNILNNIQPGTVDAWMHLPGHFVLSQQILEAEMAKRLKIPAVMSSPDEVEPDVGGLFSYNLNWRGVAEQAAVIANKVLKGSKPQDIPIEFPEKNILVINMNTAEEIGITIPQDMLQIAKKLVR